MKNIIKILLSCLLWISSGVLTDTHAAYIVSDKTPMIFHDDAIRVFEDPTNQASYEDVLRKTDQFIPAQQIKVFKSSVTYWIIQEIVSELDKDREIRIDATGWRDLTPHVIDDKGHIQKLRPTGFAGIHNPYLAGSPQTTAFSQGESQFPTFTLRRGAEVTVLTQVKYHPIFPAKTFSINFVDSVTFSEFRRFSLYMEGLLLGTLFALTIFALVNAYQSKDKVNLFYAIWISVAFLSVSSLNIIDGHRLFEFFVNIDDLKSSWPDSYAYIISIGFAFAQSISYVLFARQYLGIKKYFPVIYQATNVWIGFALLYCYLALTGAFYPADTIYPASAFSTVYSVAVGCVLLAFFVCSYLRYRAGFGFALFFTFAVVPYLVFRLGFLFGIIGLSSPFQYLPDHGFGYFLKNPWTNQAFGVCMEALIMALAVISRARWLQAELTLSAKKQTELIEQQNIILESKVEERTQELSAKHEIVVSSMNYASRLQRGQLPRSVRLEGRFTSFATVWEPRDTIGGDLYWVSSSQHSGPFVLAVADCTGHGVPGAMLSLLVSNSLERIYANDTSADPATALKALDHFIRTGLNQDRMDSESDDGCDAALLKIDRHLRKIEYAGAKIDLFHIDQQAQVHRYPSQRVSLGYKDPIKESSMPTTTTITYQDGDLFAIVTDGLTDQPGGTDAARPVSFGYRRLSALLAEHHTEDCATLTEALQSSFRQWQGANVRRDDVTVVMFKL